MCRIGFRRKSPKEASRTFTRRRRVATIPMAPCLRKTTSRDQNRRKKIWRTFPVKTRSWAATSPRGRIGMNWKKKQKKVSGENN